jgi:hypothetical protein
VGGTLRYGVASMPALNLSDILVASFYRIGSTYNLLVFALRSYLYLTASALPVIFFFHLERTRMAIVALHYLSILFIWASG